MCVPLFINVCVSPRMGQTCFTAPLNLKWGQQRLRIGACTVPGGVCMFGETCATVSFLAWIQEKTNLTSTEIKYSIRYSTCCDWGEHVIISVALIAVRLLERYLRSWPFRYQFYGHFCTRILFVQKLLRIRHKSGSDYGRKIPTQSTAIDSVHERQWRSSGKISGLLVVSGQRWLLCDSNNKATKAASAVTFGFYEQVSSTGLIPSECQDDV